MTSAHTVPQSARPIMLRARRTRLRAACAAAAAAALVGAAPVGADGIQDFLRSHWRLPLAPQGPPPAHYSPLEASLNPEACGSCHPTQYADWRESTHAAATGPGIEGQLAAMLQSDPQSAIGCIVCHGPLAEQAPLMVKDGEARPNPDYDAALRGKGVPCAACHVRGHQRFGPPRRDGSLASRVPREQLPHNGLTRTPAFLSARFCRGCHQFEAGGPALEGKLLQDTYNEWRASRFARAGVQCQNCHMPDRRHLWRGIHDPDMVRWGLSISAGADAPHYRPGDWATLRLALTSTRIGHSFPTYVTPRVVLRIELIDGEGEPVAGSRTERVIAREVTLDLSREYFDTRLRPGETAVLAYRPRLSAPGLRARFSVIVEPDAFYVRFFDVLLRQGAGRGEAQIREALDAARRSPFVLFTRDLPLT